jgi:hypothetical protein
MIASEASEVDNLIAGDLPRIAVETVIASGAGELPRGSVVSKITGGETFDLLTLGHSDGTELPALARVLAEDVDATDAEVTTVAYETGEFNENALTFGGTDDADDHRVALLAKGIVLRSAVSVE